MKTNIFIILTIALFCSISTGSLYAQKASFDNILSVEIRSSGLLVKENVITGYYMFYTLDKADARKNRYLLRILDQNLNEVASKEMVDSRTLYLQEASSDGKDIMLKFFDSNLKQVIYRKFTQDLKIENRPPITLKNKWEYLSFVSGSGNDSEIKGVNLFAIEGLGFIDYTPKMGKKLGYLINYIPSDGGKGFSFNSNSSDMVETATFLASNKEIVLSSITKRPGLFSKDFKFYVQGVDLKTGKKLFEQKIDDTKYDVNIINGFTDKKNNDFVLLGLYYPKGTKIAKEASLGLCYYRMDATGNITSRNYTSWEQDVSKFLNINAKGKIQDVGYIFFHKILQSEDGKIYAIGENYRRAASAAGIATVALGGKASTVKVVIEDLFIFQFNPDFNLEKVEIFDKSKTDFALPAGAGYLNIQLLGTVVLAYGGFDYSFTQETPDGEVFTIGYVDYEKKKGEKNELVFGAITNAESKFSTDKISLTTDATFLKVLPAKPGFVLITEYYKKAKKIDLRLEKINY